MLQGLTAELQAMKSQADRSGKDLEDIAAWPAVLPFSLSLLQPSGEIRRAVPKRGREVALAERLEAAKGPASLCVSRPTC